jgi:DNA-directed RNA polymerase specialized sigma24 family protein
MTRAEEKAQHIEALSQSLHKLQADRAVLDKREERMMYTARENGLTYAEIAVAKGCSVQAVEQWYSRRRPPVTPAY